MSYGWHELVGVSDAEARVIALRLLTEEALGRALGRKPAAPRPVCVIVDDGFDDAGSFEPVLYGFYESDLERAEHWAPTKPPLFAEPLNRREWGLILGFARADLSGAGVAAVIGRLRAEVVVETITIGRGSWERPEVRVDGIEWLSGTEWEAERREDWPVEVGIGGEHRRF